MNWISVKLKIQAPAFTQGVLGVGIKYSLFDRMLSRVPELPSFKLFIFRFTFSETDHQERFAKSLALKYGPTSPKHEQK